MINKFIHNVENETHFKFRIISGGNSEYVTSNTVQSFR